MATSNSVTQNELILIYRSAIFNTDYRSGSIFVENDHLLNILNKSILFSSETGIQAKNDSPCMGSTFYFYSSPPLLKQYGAFITSWDSFFNSPNYRTSEPNSYFHIESKWWSRDQMVNTPLIVAKYRSLLEFMPFLTKSASFYDDKNCSLIFSNLDAFKLTVNYKSTDLEILNQDYIKKIIDFLTPDLHRTQKLAILAKAVVKVCQHITDSSKQFTHLLSCLNDVYNNLENDYAIFASDFSFDKVINELENIKLEEQVKIHNIFGDIQNQVLSIPVATIIIASQMKAYDVSKGNDQLVVNTAVFIGAMIFCVLMIFVIRNQHFSLNALKTELARKQNKLKKKYPEVFSTLKKENITFDELFKRLCLQNIALHTIDFITVIGMVLTVLTYLLLTFPKALPSWTQNFLHNL